MRLVCCCSEPGLLDAQARRASEAREPAGLAWLGVHRVLASRFGGQPLWELLPSSPHSTVWCPHHNNDHVDDDDDCHRIAT